MILKKAESTSAFAKIGILGFPGSGKTYTASLIAIGICKSTKNNKVAFLDTETGSDFLLPKIQAEGIEVFQAKTRAFSDLCQTIKECQKEGVGVLIIDSITHVWRDLCDSYDRKLNRNGRLQFQDWAKIKSEWKEYTDLYINSRLHIICCGRAGYEYDFDFNEDGTKDLIKTATRMKVESEFAFEPSLVLEMERTTESKEEIKEHLGKADRKSKEFKQTHKPETGSKWIHRCYVLKDRTDTINGMQFDYPTFDNFLPHFKALNIGGIHLGVDTTRTSEDRFDSDGNTQYYKEKNSKTRWSEEIQGLLVLHIPGQGQEDKKRKAALLKDIFDTFSWSMIENMPSDRLHEGYKKLKEQLEPEPLPEERTPDELKTAVLDPSKCPEPPQTTTPSVKDEKQAASALRGRPPKDDKDLTDLRDLVVLGIRENRLTNDYLKLLSGGQWSTVEDIDREKSKAALQKFLITLTSVKPNPIEEESTNA
jgi:hypothetical protein